MENISMESTPLAAEFVRLSAELTVVQQLIKQKEAENMEQKAKLDKATTLIFLQKMRLDDKFVLNFGKEANNHGGNEDDNADIEALKILASNEGKQRLEVEKELGKLDDSFKIMIEERAHAIKRLLFKKYHAKRHKQQKISFEACLEEFANPMDAQMEKHDEKQVALGEEIRKLTKNLNSLTEVLYPQIGMQLRVQPATERAKENRSESQNILSGEEMVKAAMAAVRRRKITLVGEDDVGETMRGCESACSSGSSSTVKFEGTENNSDDSY